MNALRAIPAGILAGASAVLGGAARLAEYAARRLAPPSAPASPPPPEPSYQPPPPPPAPSKLEEEQPSAVAAGDLDLEAAPLEEELPPEPYETGVTSDLPATGESALDTAGGQARTYESHIAELADQNVSAVVRGIQDLSTEELGQLFDYESAHRKRKTVLQAIERAAAPTGDEDVFATESSEYREGNPPL